MRLNKEKIRLRFARAAATYDKEAVKDALALSKAIKYKKTLEAEIKSLQKKAQVK